MNLTPFEWEELEIALENHLRRRREGRFRAGAELSPADELEDAERRAKVAAALLENAKRREVFR